MAGTEPVAGDGALLTVRRKRSLASSPLPAVVRVDGGEVGTLTGWRKRSLQVGVDPGTHQLDVTVLRADGTGHAADVGLEFRCEPGERITVQLVTWVDLLSQRGGFKLTRIE